MTRLWSQLGFSAAATVLLMAFTAANVGATTISLTDTELGSFVELGFTGDNPGPLVSDGLGGYGVTWPLSVDEYSSLTSGITLVTPVGSAGDVFGLEVFNDNSTSWDFTLSLNGGAYTSGPV